ncbi:hypothetical protein Tco_1168380 [Tanacetum coccineum]
MTVHEFLSSIGASSLGSVSFTPNTDIVIPSRVAILAFLQSMTALAVARNPLPTSKGVSDLSSCQRYNGIMFTQDPKSAKASKGLKSPNLHDRVNSSGLHYILEHELELQEPVVPRLFCLGLKVNHLPPASSVREDA